MGSRVGAQGGYHLVFNFVGSLPHLLRVQAAERMGKGYGLEVGAAKSPGLEEGRIPEGSGADHYSGYAPVLETHRIVHTARGTGPSISYRGNYEVAALSQRID